MTADAFVQIQHHSNLRTDFHFSPPVPDRDLRHPAGNILHFADHDELVAVRSDGAVIVKAIGQLGVAANHVRWLRTDAGYRVMNAAATTGHFRTRDIHNPFLSVVHHGHPRRHPLAHHRPRGESPVGVERFNPVVIFNAQLFRVGFAKPDDRPAARQRQHQQVFAIGGVDPHFWCGVRKFSAFPESRLAARPSSG